MRKTILDLCGGSGSWSLPYAKAGYRVIVVDPMGYEFDDDEFGETEYYRTSVSLLLKHWNPHQVGPVHGVLAAPPCTDFAVSGAQYWKAKDADGRTEESLQVVKDCLGIIERCQPKWWALENPVGRLPKLLGLDYRWTFHPWEYAGYSPYPEANRYTKKTCMWGDHAIPTPKPVPPIRACKQGSWLQKLGGKSERTKRLRSITPDGFARAFFEANP